MTDEARCTAFMSGPLRRERCKLVAGHLGRQPARRTDGSEVGWGGGAQDVEAYWRDQEPIMETMDEAVRVLAPTLVGRSVAEARALVEAEAERTGLNLSIRFAAHAATTEHVYGRASRRGSGTASSGAPTPASSGFKRDDMAKPAFAAVSARACR